MSRQETRVYSKTVSCCQHCPDSEYFGLANRDRIGPGFCYAAERVTRDTSTIPDWCPLPLPKPVIKLGLDTQGGAKVQQEINNYLGAEHKAKSAAQARCPECGELAGWLGQKHRDGCLVPLREANAVRNRAIEKLAINRLQNQRDMAAKNEDRDLSKFGSFQCGELGAYRPDDDIDAQRYVTPDPRPTPNLAYVVIRDTVAAIRRAWRWIFKKEAE